MYASQIKPGHTYDKLKKCVTINIVDFKCTPIKKLYSSYHLTEDESTYRLTDILEIHFLEIPKLFDEEIVRDENDPIVQWMEFLDAKSKGVIEMLAEKNKDIKKAYDLLQIISKDEKARMLYESRQAEISDQLTRIKSAEEKGVLRVVENLLKMGLNVEQIAIAAEISIERVLEIKKGIIN
jgi:predicted transposase/invertase (TIGR01784 family)